VTQHPAHPETLYETHRLLIDQIIAGAVRQHHLTADDAAEFRSYAWEHLLAADPLERFEQRCSLRTFLTIVIRNYYRDFRNHQWGKWRPSMEARRIGPVALRLETLVARDGYSFDEAVEILRTNEQTPLTRQELERIHARLPLRVKNRLVPDDELGEIPAPPADLDGRLEQHREHALASRLRNALAAALEELTPQERMILKLLFESGFTIARVAAAMNLPQKPLYRQRDRVLALLRTKLADAGVQPEEVEPLIGRLDGGYEIGAWTGGETRRARSEGGTA
jgi:RNA polymerase sigma factor (sigma-70 family)